MIKIFPFLGKTSPRGILYDINYFMSRSVIEITKCWTWQRAYTIGRGGKRYGTFGLDKDSSYRTHHATYMLIKGEIHDGLEIDHVCENTLCCNPIHLNAVTHIENCRRRDRHITSCIRGHNLTIGTRSNGTLRRYCIICREASRKSKRVRITIDEFLSLK